MPRANKPRRYIGQSTVDYGLGGALLKIGSNIAQGKGLGSGVLQGVGRAAITPGSGIGAGAELAGNLLQKTNNPLAQKIGKGLDVASNFAPGGGGIGGAIGDVAGLAANAGLIDPNAAGAIGGLAGLVGGQQGGGAGLGGLLGAGGGGGLGPMGALKQFSDAGLIGQGGGVGGKLLNAASNFLGEAGMAVPNNTQTSSNMNFSTGHRGGIPYNPELAGAPYKMRGVRVMKGGGAVYAEYGVNTDGAKEAAAAQEETTNFLLNPEAGFQEGDIGRLGGTSGRPEQLPTFQQFFEKEYGYFPSVASLPSTSQGDVRGSDLKGAPEHTFYSDLTEKTSDEGLFKGFVDKGAGSFPTSGGRYETVEDFRQYEPGSSFQGVRYARSGAGDDELRAAYRTKADVDAANKRYAEMMKNAQLSQKSGVTMEAIDPEREGESGGFRVTGPQSLVNETAAPGARQFNGGAVKPRLMKSGGKSVYASNGVNTSGAMEAARAGAEAGGQLGQSEDERSYLQMFADELGQIASGIERVVDRSGTEFSPATESIASLFRKGYASQEEADRAREESGQSGRVDAFGRALGTFIDDEASQGRLYSGREVNPFSVAARAYERSRMTDAARNAGRQYAGGRSPVRLMKRR